MNDATTGGVTMASGLATVRDVLASRDRLAREQAGRLYVFKGTLEASEEALRRQGFTPVRADGKRAGEIYGPALPEAPFTMLQSLSLEYREAAGWTFAAAPEGMRKLDQSAAFNPFSLPCLTWI
jgi:hypothetical protein